MSAAHCIWPVAAALGEGPCWVDGALWFVDIYGQAIHRFDPVSNDQRSWPAPARVSFVLPGVGPAFIVGCPGGIHRFDPTDGSFSLLKSIERDLPDNRTNDACVGPDGALWFGSLDETGSAATGALYRWDGKGDPVQRDAGYVTSNGPAFSPDGRTFYHTDTQGKIVYAFDVGQGGSLTGKRRHIRVEDGVGWPDGSAVDAHGCLWIALWDGWCVRRYSAAGSLLDEKRLPCARATKVAFGGPALETMFVTTARTGLSAVDLTTQPLAGGLFTLPADCPGLAQLRITGC